MGEGEVALTKLAKTAESSSKKNCFGVQVRILQRVCVFFVLVQLFIHCCHDLQDKRQVPKSLAARVKILEAENVELRERLKAKKLGERLSDNWVTLIFSLDYSNAHSSIQLARPVLLM